MTVQSGHISIVFAATHLEFILPYSQPVYPLGLPSKETLDLVKVSLSKAYPVTEMPCFDELVTAIDEADEETGKSPIHDLG